MAHVHNTRSTSILALEHLHLSQASLVNLVTWNRQSSVTNPNQRAESVPRRIKLIAIGMRPGYLIGIGTRGNRGMIGRHPPRNQKRIPSNGWQGMLSQGPVGPPSLSPPPRRAPAAQASQLPRRLRKPREQARTRGRARRVWMRTRGRVNAAFLTQ